MRARRAEAKVRGLGESGGRRGQEESEGFPGRGGRSKSVIRSSYDSNLEQVAKLESALTELEAQQHLSKPDDVKKLQSDLAAANVGDTGGVRVAKVSGVCRHSWRLRSRRWRDYGDLWRRQRKRWGGVVGVQFHKFWVFRMSKWLKTIRK